MSLRIAQITLPSEDNEGKSLAFAHKSLKLELARTFGGFTAYETAGGWVNPEGELIEEDGTTYQVAFPLEQMGLIVSLAHQAGRMAHQQAVFYVVDGVAYVDNLEA